MGPRLIRHEKERPWISYYLFDHKRLQGEGILISAGIIKTRNTGVFETPQEQPGKADNEWNKKGKHESLTLTFNLYNI